MMQPQTRGLASPALEAFEMPKSRPPKPSVDRTSDAVSRLAERSATWSTSEKSTLQTTRSRQTAAMPMKTTRQPTVSAAHPPRIGPTLGANPNAMPAMPIAVAFRPAGKRIAGRFCMSGRVMPVDIAWSMRPASSIQKQLAIASSMLPAKKTMMAAQVTLRVLKRLARKATQGTVMPITSM